MNSSDKNFTSFSLKVARMSSEQPETKQNFNALLIRVQSNFQRFLTRVSNAEWLECGGLWVKDLLRPFAAVVLWWISD